MPAAHPDNGGIQVFSATQTSKQIEEALAGRGFGNFESKDYTTGPNPGEEPPNGGEQPPSEPAAPVPAEPVAPAPLAQPRVAAKPGVKERLRAENQSLREDIRRQQDETNRQLAELRTMISRGGTPPVAAPVPVASPAPVAAAPEPAVLPKFDKARPKLDDFLESEDPEADLRAADYDWLAERRDFNQKQQREQEQRTQIQESARTAQQNAAQRWDGELAATRRELPDFDAVVRKEHFDATGKPLMVVNNAMVHIARNNPGGAKILYWLGMHPEEAAKIAAKTSIVDKNDPWAVEQAIRTVHREFDRIEQELKTNPLTSGVPAGGPEGDLEDDDEPVDPGEETAVDPNLPRVASDPQAGRRVEQPPSRGTVDTRPQAPVQPVVVPKPEPIGRVGQRGVHTNRPVQALPPEAIREITPDEYRKRRAAEGSSVARG